MRFMHSVCRFPYCPRARPVDGSRPGHEEHVTGLWVHTAAVALLIMNR
jgi:hypothetical protein